MIASSLSYHPETIHVRLGPAFYDEVHAADFPTCIIRLRNDRAASQVGLSDLSNDEWVQFFGKFSPLPGTLTTPLALRYHGHQFRSYNPELGDGRGFLYAQLRDRSGRLLDLGTKGSGQTPWSRRGDGRLTLKGGVREALASAMLEALGVNTSRTFSLIETGESLIRHDEPSPTRASVLVRLSHSHIRIGTFQRMMATRDHENLARLVEHCVAHYWPAAMRPTIAESAIALLEMTLRANAQTCARWMAAGFVHGVLNTDNINITGESFDYGPFRFLPIYDPGFTAAYFDEYGLYAFGRQPETIAWNLARLADCLAILAPVDALEEVLQGYSDIFWEEMRDAVTRRLGLERASAEADDVLIAALFGWLRATRAPFEAAFFDLYGGLARFDQAKSGPRAVLYADASFAPLRFSLQGRQAAQRVRLDHPYFSRPQPITLLYDDIEAVWASISQQDDWSDFEEKLREIDILRDAYGFVTVDGSAEPVATGSSGLDPHSAHDPS